MAKNKVLFYSLERILKENAQYNVIFGERSNGKTFSVEEYALQQYRDNGGQLAIVRRFDTDFQGNNCREMFTHFIKNDTRGNIVEEMFKDRGGWTDIYYYSQCWYLCKYDEKNGLRIKDPVPFAYAFAISAQEHSKSVSYPKITTILFDEFLTRKYYLPDEFVLFTNLLSTIIRTRDNVKIFMCGNTVNKFSPYFKEMGLDSIEKMNPNDIQVYRFATMHNQELRIAVEYADNLNKKGKPSDVYFAFNNPKLKMITNGMWELAVYPHLPYKYERSDILTTYFIIWEHTTLQCEIINVNDDTFTYIHRKTTPIQDENEDIVFTPEYCPQFNYRRKIDVPVDNANKRIYFFFKTDKVFYQDNEVGEVVRNYLIWCRTDRGFQ